VDFRAEQLQADELLGRSMKLVCLPEEQPASDRICLLAKLFSFAGRERR
jgi:hypothetical protein